MPLLINLGIITIERNVISEHFQAKNRRLRPEWRRATSRTTRWCAASPAWYWTSTRTRRTTRRKRKCPGWWGRRSARTTKWVRSRCRSERSSLIRQVSCFLLISKINRLQRTLRETLIYECTIFRIKKTAFLHLLIS